MIANRISALPCGPRDRTTVPSRPRTDAIFAGWGVKV
jgi:hypothetical protein